MSQKIESGHFLSCSPGTSFPQVLITASTKGNYSSPEPVFLLSGTSTKGNYSSPEAVVLLSGSGRIALYGLTPIKKTKQCFNYYARH